MVGVERRVCNEILEKLDSHSRERERERDGRQRKEDGRRKRKESV